MLNFSIPLPAKVGLSKKDNATLPALPTLAPPVQTLAAPLNTKGVPKWISDVLSQRHGRSVSTADEDSEKFENEADDSFHAKGSDLKKVSLSNFVHFSPLMCTYVCLTPNIKANDPDLEKLGPEVSQIIRKCVAPFSLYGRITRDSGDDSLVVQFRLPDIALSPGQDLSLIEETLDEAHIPFVNKKKFSFSSTCLKCSGGQTGGAEAPRSSKANYSEYECDNSKAEVPEPASLLKDDKRYSFASNNNNGTSTVCFTLPVRCCVPLIQRILEKANLMNAVQEYATDGKIDKAVELLSQFLDSSKSSVWRRTCREEVSSLLSFRAHLYFHLGAFNNAIKDAKRAIEIDPTQVEGYSVAAKSFISLGYPDLAESIVSGCVSRVKFLTIRFVRGSILCTLVSAFQRWRNSGTKSKIRLEILPLAAAVRFAAYRYNRSHTSDEVSIASSSSSERHAVLDSYLTHPLKHPSHPGLSIDTFSDLENAGMNGFPESSRATATWINCVYSTSFQFLKNELLEFCSSPMFYTCRGNRAHATRAFSPKSQLFEEKVSLLLPVLGMGARIRMGENNSMTIRSGDGVIWCNYCGGILHVDPQVLRGGGSSMGSGGVLYSNSSCVVCSLGCGATYCSEECHDRAASEYHWIQCPKSILLNISPTYSLEGNWTAVSFSIRRVLLRFDYFITALVPEVKLSQKNRQEPIDETTDSLCPIAISLRIYKQIISMLLSFVLWPLLGILPMSPNMEELVLRKNSKLELLLRELESKSFKVDAIADRYNLLLAEKIFHAMDIPFTVDENYSSSPTVAEELGLCPSLSLLPTMSKRDMKFSSQPAPKESILPAEMKSTCAAAIWTFTQSIAGVICEFLSNTPLSVQRLLSPGSQSPEDSIAGTKWTYYSFLSFLGSSRFISQLWDFCCTGYSIGESTFVSCVDCRGRKVNHVMNEFSLPVVVISPHLSIITDLGDFAGSYAYSRYCFEHEIQLRIVRKSPEESIMSVCSFANDDSVQNDSDDSITPNLPPIPDVYDPSPWIQWCSSIAAGCTNIDTPTVYLRETEGQRERYVSVSSSGIVKLDDMVRLKSLWYCI